MPRKETLSIEERLERAKEIFTRKQNAKHKEISQLHKTRIYILAKRSCIVFLWIAQLLFIDWLLPYLSEKDIITDGYRVVNSAKSRQSVTDFYITINTNRYKKLELFIESESIEPQTHDSVVVLKSLLLHDVKKINDTNRNETYLVSNSITYLMLPLIIIPAILSILFLFIRNIEVKSFYYFMFILNTFAVIVLLIYYVKQFS